jgi:ssDNA-binding Zn-finger/Zn-ribbon topoisomerase 1
MSFSLSLSLSVCVCFSAAAKNHKQSSKDADLTMLKKGNSCGANMRLYNGKKGGDFAKSGS